MLTAVISDVHSNLPALEAVLNKIKLLNCAHIISLGDIVGYHCFHNECIDIFKKENITNLMGNHDRYLSWNIPCTRSNSVNKILEYQKKTITQENLRWLQSSKKILRRNKASFVHAGWNDYHEEYLYDISETYFTDFTEEFFFSGHTHIQSLQNINGKIYCNPGSVGQPRDNDPRAAFAVFDEKSIELFRVAYDIERVQKKMADLKFDAYFFENLSHGLPLGSQNKISRR